VPDPALEALPDEDREAVARWLDVLGFEVDELGAVPPMRLLVDVLASAHIARGLMPTMGRRAAWATAGELIGRRGLLRRWYDWQAAASADSAQADGERATLCGDTSSECGK
jgi:hypothetical protein